MLGVSSFLFFLYLLLGPLSVSRRRFPVFSLTNTTFSFISEEESPGSPFRQLSFPLFVGCYRGRTPQGTVHFCQTCDR